MAKGTSGRIVIEIDPQLKRELYSLIALENKTLKEWFVEHAEEFVNVRKSKIYPGTVKK